MTASVLVLMPLPGAGFRLTLTLLSGALVHSALTSMRYSRGSAFAFVHEMNTHPPRADELTQRNAAWWIR